MKNDKKKLSRKERERRMIAEMDAAMWGKKLTDETAESVKEAEPQKKTTAKPKTGTEQALHCPRCKSVMERGKCPTCGHYIYVPMDKEKRNKIRWIVGGVCIVGFVILFVLLQLKG